MGKKEDEDEKGSRSEESSSDDSSDSSDDEQDDKHHRKRKRDKNEEEAREKERNREATKKRSRMWQVMSSSESSEGEDESDGDKKERRKKEEDGDDDDDKESSSRSESVEKSSSSKKEKKEKKKRKHKKEHKKDSKKHKKHKKHKKEDKKHKKHKKRKKEEQPESMRGAVDLNQYGKYGILREGDFSRKKRDFEVWLAEVQGIPEIPRLKYEAMKYFRQYMEDYNTATFPHKKYYDVEKYEMDEYKKQLEKERFKQMRQQGLFNDEAEHAAERKKTQEQRDREDFEWAMKMMNKDKIEAMKEQEILKAKMQMAYKAGDMVTVKKIEFLLMTDEEKEKLKRQA